VLQRSHPSITDGGVARPAAMALVFFATGAAGLIMLPLMIFHQIQLFVCAVIASRMSRTDAQEKAGA
jgi:predicted Na+-dependent transporter